MRTFQQRVIDEEKELSRKIGRLSEFRETETFKILPEVDRDHLCRQLEAMIQYRNILGLRIARFK